VDLVEKKNGEAIFIKTDMTQEKNVEYLVEQTLDHFGKLDILYNNAGVNSDEKKIPDVTMEEWKKVIDINLTGTFLGMKLAIQHLKLGVFIINPAGTAEFNGKKLVSESCATKGSVFTLTKP